MKSSQSKMLLSHSPQCIPQQCCQQYQHCYLLNQLFLAYYHLIPIYPYQL